MQIGIGNIASDESGIAERRIGTAPRLTYKFKDETTGISLPVYLLPKTADGLVTGVQVGRRDDTDRITAGILGGGSLGPFD